MKISSLKLTCIIASLFLLFSFNSKASLSVTVSVTNVTCNGASNGTATANISGGTAPYSYLWSTGATTSSISGLTPGTYVVYVNDANNDGGTSVGTVNTFAGQTTAGSNNGTGTAAKFSAPKGVVTDGNGNLFVADGGNNQIRQIVISTGVVTTLAGSTTSGSANGTGTAASFYNPTGLAYDGNGNLYVADQSNNEIRKIVISTGVVTTLAGSTTYGSNNGTGSSASFHNPHSLVYDGSGNLYVTDNLNNEIRKVTTSGVVTTFAGTTTAGTTNGTGTSARFNQPYGITIDGAGNLYIAEYGNNDIRKIAISTAAVTTLAGTTATGAANGLGTSATFNHPTAIVWDGGNNLFIADFTNNEIREVCIPTTLVSTLAGTTSSGHANGTGSAASFNSPQGVTIDNNGNVYVADQGNNEIRIVVPSFAGIYNSNTITQPAALTASTSPVGVSCNGLSNGSATVTASGGTSPYTYSWSNGATTSSINNLAIGTYSVTVTDANLCTTSTTATITQPSVLSASANTTANASCFGCTNGSVSVSVSGGTPSYNYSWTGGATTSSVSGLAAGTYTVTVTDAHGCTSTSSTTVTQPGNPLTANITSSNNVTICNGDNNGSATVTASGGTPGYSYSWAPTGGTNATANNLTAGSYTVTVTDASSNQATATVTINQPTAVTATITSQNNPLCNGSANGSATVTGNGGTGTYTYLWTDANASTTASVNDLSAGTTNVTVTDGNGCHASTGVTLSNPASVTATITSQNNPLCNGSANGSATVTGNGGTGTYTYLWTDANASTTASVNDLSAGTTNVTVTDGNGCHASTGVTLSNPASVTATITSQNNPLCNGSANGSATVTGNGGTGTYTYLWTDANASTTASVNDLSAGTTNVTVTDGNGCHASTGVTLSNPASVTATITSQNNPLCNGSANGTATVTGNGGTGTYTYLWTDANASTTASVNDLSAGTTNVTVTDGNGCFANTSVTLTNPASVTATITSQNNPLCNGSANGSATVTGNGGTGTYTYLWTDANASTTASVNDLSAGTTNVTVTDGNGCFANTSVTLTNPASVTATITSQNNPLCNGSANGSATVTGNGGTGTYTYLWTDANASTTASVNDLSAGTTNVTVTDGNGCHASTGVTLSNPATVTATIISQNNPLCNGSANGTATVTGNGGTGTYTYLWTDANASTTASVNDLSAGTTNVTVTDGNGCHASTGVTLSNPASVTATITSQNNPLCNGSANGSATVTGNGGTGTYTYLWTDANASTTASVNDLSAGTTNVTVTDGNGCHASTGVTLSNPASVTATITSQNNPLCNGSANGTATVTGNGGTGTYTYLWTDANASTTASVNDLSAGTTNVTVTDGNGCFANTSVTLTNPASVTATITSQNNPLCNGSANGSATVTGNGGTGTYTYLWTDANASTTASVNDLSAGTTNVTVTDGNGCHASTGVTLSNPASVTATITSQNNPLCNGSANGTATVTGNGGTGTYTYLWTDANASTTASVNDLSAGTTNVTVTDGNGCFANTSVTLTNPASVTATITSQNNPLCNGSANGSATVTGNGGTGTYTYLWTDANASTTASVNDLSAGTTNVTVTDGNGCHASTGVTLSDPAAFSAYLSFSSEAGCSTCANGTAVVTATGGSGSYSYTWSDGETTSSVTDLLPGSYTCTVSNDCGSTIVSVNITSNFTLTMDTIPTYCYAGGEILEKALGGTPPYNYYVIQNGIPMFVGSSSGPVFAGGNLTGGTYQGYVIDNVGDSIASLPFIWNMIIPAAPGVCYVSVDTSSEHNVIYWADNGDDSYLDSVIIYRETVSGYVEVGSVAPGTTSFTDMSSNSDVESSYYKVSGMDNCDSTNSPSSYNQTVLLQANIGVGGVVNLSWNAYQGNTVSYYVILRDTGTGYYRYDSVPYNIYAYTDLAPTQNSLQYMVSTVWAPLGCSAVTESHSNKKVINVTGINSVNNPLSSITVYPNPVKDMLTISIPTPTEGTITVTDVLGQQISSERLESNTTTKQINMANMSEGVYFIKITSGNKEVVKRIVKL